MKVGFVVNPVAGMGGPVGLKGTDGAEIQREAIARGAFRTSLARAEAALREIRRRGTQIDFVTCAGQMGEAELSAVGLGGKVIYVPSEPSSGNDTKEAARLFLREGVELILFAGGDGTARDIAETIDRKVPIIGIPSGVKMHSAVFAIKPGDVAELLETYDKARATKDAEIMDVDEEAFRQGALKARLYGYALVPDDRSHLQCSKMSYHSGTADDESDEIGQYMSEMLEKDVMYIIGPGSTTESIAKHLGQSKTLLGVDVLIDSVTIAQDASEAQLLDLLGDHRDARIVVSPIGAQGFILGRGNQQISPKVVRAAGPDNIIVVSTPTKLRSTPVLRVDTGDSALDGILRGRRKVITGYQRRRLVTVE